MFNINKVREIYNFIIFFSIYNKIRMKFKRNIVMKRDNFSAINEIREMLGTTKKLTLESFIMPDEDASYTDVAPQDDVEEFPREEKQEGRGVNISGIEKELTQIRKIALSVINRLADRPTSPQYDTMKKIWNMVDKAIEQPQKGNGNFSD